METSTPTLIKRLKKDLVKVIETNNYNLLSPEVIELSSELDRLMLPLFKRQIDDELSI
ncbi:MAG: aspartyl-phosphate phosphatase Spo0E family protein [Cellulosilyticum sp.]|nr:aspartyl-phosphate phosphatase Spo0E family protein [Cellulosilyticum sp.]MEE1071802.1 aspartyl-phosphate phosphatase Spo0E family protein [Cellulosilyticum sp.]